MSPPCLTWSINSLFNFDVLQSTIEGVQCQSLGLDHPWIIKRSNSGEGGGQFLWVTITPPSYLGKSLTLSS